MRDINTVDDNGYCSQEWFAKQADTRKGEDQGVQSVLHSRLAKYKTLRSQRRNGAALNAKKETTCNQLNLLSEAFKPLKAGFLQCFSVLGMCNVD